MRHCEVIFDENVLHKDKEKINFETTEPVGVELELRKIHLVT